MELLFSYTGPLIKDADGNYYSRTITDKMLSRYFAIADKVSICTRVNVIVDKNELQKLTKINTKNLNVIECPNISSITGAIIERLKTKKIVKRAVKKADLVIVRLPCLHGNLIASISKQQKKPYLVEAVGCPKDVYWYHSLKGKILSLPSYFAMKKATHNASFALYVTKEFLQKRYPYSGESIGCSDVNLQPLEESILLERLTKIRKISRNKPLVIGTTAAVNVKYKGQQYIIEAISRLKKIGYNFEYHLVGDGENSFLKSVAKKYEVEEKVRFLGPIPHGKIFDFLDGIDIYIQPSEIEGLPRSLVEALSRACPSLGSKVGGIPELLNKDLTFNKGKIEEICRLLKKMDKEMLENEAIRSFKKANEFNSTDLDIRRTEFYKKYLSSLE
jgi:glycosyltransferase involved in cell wall biosynthesis